MITLDNIYSYIKEFADERLAEKWDNVGIMLGAKNQKINNVLICLDISSNVVDEAILKKADLIISHHPLIFKPLKKLQFEDFKSNIIKKLIKNDIAVISAHTNLDSAEFGLNNYLADILDLNNVNILFENCNYPNSGLGRIGFLKKNLSINDFVCFVKKKLNLEYVKLISNNDSQKLISKVAILGGSGGSFIYNLPDVDIYLTGDVSYHEAQDALEMNKTILDIGHFSEAVCKELLKNYLSKKDNLNEINIYLSEVEKNPFRIM